MNMNKNKKETKPIKIEPIPSIPSSAEDIESSGGVKDPVAGAAGIRESL